MACCRLAVRRQIPLARLSQAASPAARSAQGVSDVMASITGFLAGHDRFGDASGDAGCFVDAGMDREYVDQAGDGKHPQDLLLRRGQQQVKPGAPGVLPRKRQRCQAAGVDELQALQVDNDIASAGRYHGQRRRDIRRFCYVKFPRSATTAWPSPSRVLISMLTISGSPFRFSSSKGRVRTRRGSFRQWSAVTLRWPDAARLAAKQAGETRQFGSMTRRKAAEPPGW
jgi:hypothetical protein